MSSAERVGRFVARRVDAETFLGLDLTLSLLIAGGAIWLCGALIEAVLDNAMMVRLDVVADAWVHQHVTPHGLSIFQVISELGSPTSMGVLCVGGAILLARDRHFPLLVTWIAAFAGSGILGRVLKAAVHRGRPTLGIDYLTNSSYSFPSGHSAASFVGVTMLLIVLRRLEVVKGRWFAVVVALGATFVILVGVSRVYLGVHFPSDVIGGYAVSAAWTSVCIGVAGVVLHHRGRSLASRSYRGRKPASS